MSENVASLLHAVCVDPPEDLIAHFAAPPIRDLDLSINTLDVGSAVFCSEALADLDYGAALGLIALDDANDSNPYCYVTKGPCAGLVFHLRHDGDPCFVFSSLDTFKDALRGLIANRKCIDDIVPESRFPSVDQGQLQAFLRSAVKDEVVVEVICAYLPVLQEPLAELLANLADIDDFYLREALAEYIVARPQSEYLAVAEALAGDSHPQVARPGANALKAVKRIGSR